MGSTLLFLSFLLKNGLVFAMLPNSGSLWCRGSGWLGRAQGGRHVLPRAWLCRGGPEGVVGAVGAAHRLQPHVPSLRCLQKMFSD